MEPALTAESIDAALAIQSRAYALLCWMETAIESGIISPERGVDYAGEAQAAQGWIEKHVRNFPPEARPPAGQQEAFANYFSSFLTSTFDLEPTPGQRLYSKAAHCFCPCCSWLVNRPHLRPRKVTKRDKTSALRRVAGFIRQASLDAGVTVSDRRLHDILDCPELLFNPDYS